jgi:UDP-N-acetyl-D-mannosaminuronic acid transferase (WecB/TagA/CpsF family)
MTKRAPIDEIMVELDDRHIPVQVMVNEVERRTYQAALQEADFALHDAAGIFALLRDLVGQSAKVTDGVYSVLNVCAKHFGQMAEREAEEVNRLSARLRQEAHQADTFRKGEAQ